MEKACRILAATITLVSLALLPISCSDEQAGGQSRQDQTRETQPRETRTGDASPSPGTSPSEPRGSLVPIAHLTSARDDVSVEELSQDPELAVPQELSEAASEVLGRSDLKGTG